MDLPDTGALLNDTIVKASAGETVVLPCNSNDWNHNFMYWLFGKDKVVGPGNDYDEIKYNYEVLSGNLHIADVSPADSGYYKCISKKLDGSGISISELEMIVSQPDGSTIFSAIDAVKLVAIVVSIIVLISCAAIYLRPRKDWNKIKYDNKIQVNKNGIDVNKSVPSV